MNEVDLDLLGLPVGTERACGSLVLCYGAAVLLRDLGQLAEETADFVSAKLGRAFADFKDRVALRDQSDGTF